MEERIKPQPNVVTLACHLMTSMHSVYFLEPITLDCVMPSHLVICFSFLCSAHMSSYVPLARIFVAVLRKMTLVPSCDLYSSDVQFINYL